MPFHHCQECDKHYCQECWYEDHNCELDHEYTCWECLNHGKESVIFKCEICQEETTYCHSCYEYCEKHICDNCWSKI